MLLPPYSTLGLSSRNRARADTSAIQDTLGKVVSGSIFRLFYLPRMLGQLRYSIKSFALDP